MTTTTTRSNRSLTTVFHSTLLLTLLSLALHARADAPLVLYNNLGTNDDFHPAFYASVVNTNDPGMGNQYSSMAMQFSITGGADVSLTSLRAGFSGVGSLTLAVTTSSNGSPGLVLETITSPINSRGIYDFTSTVIPTLTAGQDYWVVAIGEPGSQLNWYYDSALSAGISKYSPDGSSWFSDGGSYALQVLGQPAQVPEPQSVLFLASGIMTILIGRRHQTQSRR